MKTNIIKNMIFIGFHFTLITLFFVDFTLYHVMFFVLMYFLVMFGVIGGYHRYFAHKSFKTTRTFQFILALLGTLSLQKGVLHWAANHRIHHQFSDQKGDIHSPVLDGFWYSHIGWILYEKDATKYEKVKDLTKFSELVFLDDHFLSIFIAWCLSVHFVLGFGYLVYGCFLTTIATWHMTFFVNSVLHVWGSQDFHTGDQSRNNIWLTIPLMGANWHNNHHFYQKASSLWWKWYQVDIIFLILYVLSKFNIVWELTYLPSKVVVLHSKRNK